jgi:homoserine kinase
VDLQNELVLERGPFRFDIYGEGETSLPRDETNAIISAVKDGYAAIFPDETLPIEDLKFTSINRIPPARGLGSSSAALVAGLAAGLALAGQDLAAPQTKQLLLQLAADAEGHPDNVAPAIYGGFQVSINTGMEGARKWVTQAIKLPRGMQAVLFIPEFESLTAETRAALPTKIPVQDAVFNISRAAMLINSFATDNFEALRYACQDVIHQPIRGTAFPLNELIDAALGKGAHGAFLSGAGPTVLALTGGHGSDVDADTMVTFLAVEVADAMLEAAEANECKGRAVISSPSATGVRCHKEDAATDW